MRSAESLTTFTTVFFLLLGSSSAKLATATTAANNPTNVEANAALAMRSFQRHAGNSETNCLK